MARETRSTPEKFSTTPPPGGNGDLPAALWRAVFELNGAVGELKQAIRTLTTQTETQGATLNEINDQVKTARTVLWILGGALTVIGGIGLYILDKLWELALLHFGK